MATPHDALFKQVFSQPEHAAGELRHALPETVTRHLDWSSLALVPGSFVDEGLRDRHADLLFEVRLAGRQAFLYLLLEHKSAADPWTPFQLLVYAVRIWERFRRDHPGATRLPALIPVVVHHSETGWTGSTELIDLFDVEDTVRSDVVALLPNLRFLLDDLGKVSSEQLYSRANTALARLALFCLQRARHSGNLLEELRPWREAFRAVLRASNGSEALVAVLWYIIQVQSLPPEEVHRFLLDEVGPETEKTMTSTYDQLVNRGRAELLLKQLTARFEILPDEIVDRLRRASAEELDRWALRVLDAKTLDEVFEAG